MRRPPAAATTMSTMQPQHARHAALEPQQQHKQPGHPARTLLIPRTAARGACGSRAALVTETAARTRGAQPALAAADPAAAAARRATALLLGRLRRAEDGEQQLWRSPTLPIFDLRRAAGTGAAPLLPGPPGARGEPGSACSAWGRSEGRFCTVMYQPQLAWRSKIACWTVHPGKPPLIWRVC
jgi:hypothetical protein